MIALANIKATLVTGALCLCVGFSAGYYTKAQFVKADKVEQSKTELAKAREIVKQSSVAVKDAVSKSVEISERIENSSNNQATIRKEATRRVQEQETIGEQKNDSDNSISGGAGLAQTSLRDACVFYLDYGTVRLYNAAIAGKHLGATGTSDGEGEAPSAPSDDAETEVKTSDVVENALTVIDMYHELAIKHNELVDAVNKKLQEQTGDRQ